MQNLNNHTQYSNLNHEKDNMQDIVTGSEERLFKALQQSKTEDESIYDNLAGDQFETKPAK